MTTPTVSRSPEEVLLAGGSTNAGLVTRVGETVRRPLRPTSPATRALFDHLARVGFEGAPRYLGVDGRGREVLSYIRGEAPIAPYPEWAHTDGALVSVARLLRRYHDAVTGFDPAGYSWPRPVPATFRRGLISHNDPNLDNIIFDNGRAVALIDFDLAGPGSAAWDLACCARLWVPLRASRDTPWEPEERRLTRLRIFADAYGASSEDRMGLVQALVPAHDWCYAIIGDAIAGGHKTFSRQWSDGAGPRARRTRRWLVAHATQMRDALDV